MEKDKEVRMSTRQVTFKSKITKRSESSLGITIPKDLIEQNPDLNLDYNTLVKVTITSPSRV